MKTVRCSITGYLTSVNGMITYDKDKKIIMAINSSDDNLFEHSSYKDILVTNLMKRIFANDVSGAIQSLRTFGTGRVQRDADNVLCFTFYKKDDPDLMNHLNNGSIPIQSNGPMIFKISKLTADELKPAGDDAAPDYDLYDLLLPYIDVQSSKFNSDGYEAPKLINDEIVITAPCGFSRFSPYPDSLFDTPEPAPSISCADANYYSIIELFENYDDSVNTSGTFQIDDTVTGLSKIYTFSNFTEFFNSQLLRETVAYHYQSLYIEDASGGGSHFIGLTGGAGNGVHALKIIIKLNNPDVKLLAFGNSAITGDSTNRVTFCISPYNSDPK